jgi:LysM repeat protein
MLLAIAAVGALVLIGQASFGRSASPRSVKVAWGDTLWGLSQRYGVSMQQLAAANHMRLSDVLYAGTTLYLPSAGGFDATAPTPSIPASPVVAVAPGSFCATYQAPTHPRGVLPASLAASPSLLALRSTFAHWAEAYGVPVSLIEAEAWQESGWNNHAVSPAGAVGIGQLLPATAAFVNQSLGTNLSLSNPSDNIHMMAAFLGYLLRASGGNVCDAVASYYQGLGTTIDVGVLPVSQIYVRDVLSLRPRFL